MILYWQFTHLLQKTAMDMLPFKASEGDFIRNGWVSEDFTLSEFLFRKGMTVPNRLRVRPEAFSKSIPMSVWSKFYAKSEFIVENILKSQGFL